MTSFTTIPKEVNIWEQVKNFQSKYTSKVNNLRIQLQDRDAEISSLKTKIDSFTATALANAANARKIATRQKLHQTKTNKELNFMTISKEKLKCQLVKLKRELRDKNTQLEDQVFVNDDLIIALQKSRKEIQELEEITHASSSKHIDQTRDIHGQSLDPEEDNNNPFDDSSDDSSEEDNNNLDNSTSSSLPPPLSRPPPQLTIQVDVANTSTRAKRSRAILTPTGETPHQSSSRSRPSNFSRQSSLLSPRVASPRVATALKASNQRRSKNETKKDQEESKKEGLKESKDDQQKATPTWTRRAKAIASRISKHEIATCEERFFNNNWRGIWEPCIILEETEKTYDVMCTEDQKIVYNVKKELVRVRSSSRSMVLTKRIKKNSTKNKKTKDVIDITSRIEKSSLEETNSEADKNVCGIHDCNCSVDTSISSIRWSLLEVKFTQRFPEGCDLHLCGKHARILETMIQKKENVRCADDRCVKCPISSSRYCRLHHDEIVTAARNNNTRSQANNICLVRNCNECHHTRQDLHSNWYCNRHQGHGTFAIN